MQLSGAGTLSLEGKTLTSPEGVWSVDNAGLLTFTPAVGYEGAPPAVGYTVQDTEGNVSEVTTVTPQEDDCLMEIGGNVLLDTNGPEDGVAGTPISGSGIFWMSLVADGASSPNAVVAVDASGVYKFTDIAPGTYKIVVSNSAAGSISPSLPMGYYLSVEGGEVISGTSQGDGTADGQTTITVSCASISYSGGRINATASYLENNFGFSDTPLPATLTSLKVFANSEGNVVAWKTTEEKNFDEFSIEKSINLKNGFSKIGAVKGGHFDYSFTDKLLSKGNTYYRLKMIDLDGSFAYSRIVNIYHAYGPNEHVIFPNPSLDHTIKIYNYFEIEHVKVIDMNGKEVKIQIHKTAQHYQLIIDKNAKAGFYILEYQVGPDLIRRKFNLLN